MDYYYYRLSDYGINTADSSEALIDDLLLLLVELGRAMARVIDLDGRRFFFGAGGHAVASGIRDSGPVGVTQSFTSDSCIINHYH